MERKRNEDSERTEAQQRREEEAKARSHLLTTACPARAPL
jgi:hypothetical protein